MVIVVVIPAEILEAYTHPAIDLVTGQIVELSPEQTPIQLDLFQEESPASQLGFKLSADPAGVTLDQPANFCVSGVRADIAAK